MTATASAQHSTQVEPISKVPLTRLVRVELRKITDTRAGKWLLITIGLVTAAAMVILFFAGAKGDLTFDNFISVAGTPQGFLLPVLGILAITSEWSQRTGLVTFTLEPSRSRVVIAKFIAMVLLGLVAVILAFALAAGANLLAEAFQGGSGTWDVSLGDFGEIALVQILGILEGLAFGMLLMSSAAAIVVFFVAPIVWSILFSLISALNSAASWVDLNTAQQPLLDHTMTTENWFQVAVAAGIWVVLPMVIGAVRLMRSEIK